MKGLKLLSIIVSAALFAGTAFSAEAIFSNSFEDSLKTIDKNVVVVFETDWCGYCQKLKGDKNHLNFNNYVVCVIDAEERNDLVKKNSISSYPTSIIFYNGKEIVRKKGYDKKSYQKWLNENRKN